MSDRRISFRKMHGLGNDFVIVDARAQDVALSSAKIAAIADRHRGIGCDQLIILRSSDRADVLMQIFNADGGEVEACGNATRCVASLFDGPVTIETVAGLLHAVPDDAGVTVDFGAPDFSWEAVPLAYAMDTAALPLAWEELESPAAITIGNSHLVFFVPDVETVDLERLGPIIEHDPAFPERINVNIATLRSDGSVAHRVWERGAGLTQACGTGACAVAIAAIKFHGLSAPVSVNLPGGRLVIDWAPGGSVSMTGPATLVFEGSFDPDAFG